MTVSLTSGKARQRPVSNIDTQVTRPTVRIPFTSTQTEAPAKNDDAQSPSAVSIIDAGVVSAIAFHKLWMLWRSHAHEIALTLQ